MKPQILCIGSPDLASKTIEILSRTTILQFTSSQDFLFNDQSREHPYEAAIILDSHIDDFLNRSGFPPGLPVLLIFNSYDEDRFCRAYKKNVSDCIVKDAQGHYVSLLKRKLEQTVSYSHIKKRTSITEEALKYCEEKYNTIFEHSNDSILLMKEEKIVACNKRTADRFGCPFEEIIGQNFLDFSPYLQPDGKKSEELGLIYIQRAIQREPQSFEWLLVNKEGIGFFTEISLYSIHIPGVDLLAIIHDISRRKQAVSALRESEANYRLLIENQTEYITKIDRDGKYQFVSPSYCKLLGLAESDMLGKHVYSFLKEYTHKDDIDNVLTQFMKLFDAPAKVDVEARTLSGEGVKWIAWTERSILKKNGDFNFIIAVGRDITEKKKAEEEALFNERQLIQSEKMASLGVLISGIAHEINNPNNFILLNSKIIHRIWKETIPILDEYHQQNSSFTLSNMPYPELKNQITNIFSGLINGSDRIKNIVNSLKEFSQPDMGIWNQHIDINEAINSSLLICNTIIKNSTDNLKVSLSEKLPTVKGNLQQLEQVIINLIINACQALENKQKSIIITSDFEKERDSVIVTIRDEGKGISKKELNKIFDPFYTTKTETGGTGLGLSISYNIMKKFKGTIKFSSIEKKGTTAKIILPLKEKKKGPHHENLS